MCNCLLNSTFKRKWTQGLYSSFYMSPLPMIFLYINIVHFLHKTLLIFFLSMVQEVPYMSSSLISCPNHKTYTLSDRNCIYYFYSWSDDLALTITYWLMIDQIKKSVSLFVILIGIIVKYRIDQVISYCTYCVFALDFKFKIWCWYDEIFS